MFKKILVTLGVAGLLTVGFGAVSASAHTPNANIDCTHATVSLVSYDAHATADVTVDGVVKHTGEFGGKFITDYPFAATPNLNHSLVVHVVSKDGARYNYDFTKSVTGCPKPTVPPVPANKVDNSDSVDCKTNVVTTTTTTTEYGWVYDNSSNTWVAAAPVVSTSTSTRPATAQECPPVSTPTPTPTTTPPTHHKPTPPTHHSVGTDKLAYTGGTIQWWEWPAFTVLVLGGLGLVFLAYKRAHRA